MRDGIRRQWFDRCNRMQDFGGTLERIAEILVPLIARDLRFVHAWTWREAGVRRCIQMAGALRNCLGDAEDTVDETPDVTDLLGLWSWTCRAGSCEPPQQVAHDARPGRKRRVVRGEGQSVATPEEAAPVAVAPRAEDFARAVAAGDTAALADLYDSTVAKVHALVKAIVRNPADAEEVTCDVYTQAWQTAVHFDPARGSVMAWLMNIARSRALDCLRRQGDP